MTLYQHRFHGTLPAGDEFVFSWWANSIRGLPDAQIAALQWLTDLNTGATGFTSKCTAGVVFNKVSTAVINILTGRQTELAEDVVAQPGSAAGNSLPQELALVVSLRTALANRSGRGRFYLPCLAASTLTADGKVSAATIGDIMARLDIAWAAYNTLTSTPVVYSRTLTTTNDITSFNIGNLFDVQTRRDNKVAEVRTTLPMAA